MKIINKLILTICLMLILNLNVSAANYAVPSNHDFSNWQQIDLQLGGATPHIYDVAEDQDGNYIMLALYKDILVESGSIYIPGENIYGQPSPGGTVTRNHSKIIKYDKKFNKIFEKDYYVQGNFETDEPYAPTVATQMEYLAVLSDGSFVTAGYTWGLLNDKEIDDRFDSIFVRFDKNGNVLFEGHYFNSGLEKALTVEALKDGGYIVKFYYEGSEHWETKAPTVLPVDTVSMYYYVVYNSNNEIVEAFPEEEKSKLDSYSFIDENSADELFYYGTDEEQKYTFSRKIHLNDGSTIELGLDEGYIQNGNYHIPYKNYIGRLYDKRAELKKTYTDFAAGTRFFVSSDDTIISYWVSYSCPATERCTNGDLSKLGNRIYVNYPLKNTKKTYSVGFSQSWGLGLICEGGYSNIISGYCSIEVDPGGSIILPSSSSYNGYDNNYKFIGWTNSPLQEVNGQLSTVCTSDTIKAAGSNYTVNGSSEFYACYREDINGTRYAQEGASADGQAIKCGSALNITECVVGSDGVKYCKYNKVGNNTLSGIVYRDKLTLDKGAVSCSSYNVSSGNTNNVTTINDYRYGTVSAIIDQNFQCGAKLYITTCNQDTCNFVGLENPDGTSNSNVTGTVNRKYLKATQTAALDDKENCPEVSNSEKCNNKKHKNVEGTVTFEACYPKDYEDSDVKKMLINDGLFTCKDGLTYDETAIRAIGDVSCGKKVCRKTFTVTCELTKKEDSIIILTNSVNVGSDGYGNVNVTAYSKSGSITGYYISEVLVTPTLKSDWIEQTSSKFTVRSTPGIKYIWVKDSKGTISGVATIYVIDNTTSNTTIKQLSLTDGNNKSIVPDTVAYVSDTNDGFKLLTNAVNNKSLIAKGFDPYTPEYKIDVESPTLTVYATLTSTDSSYVEGYGPRTVNLKYGVNTILIKIRNNEGKIRTYTIIATRVDDRSSDNTLNDISLSVGNIQFNSNVTEYKIEIPGSTTSVKVNSVISSDKASYVTGYEPGEVSINENTTVKLIKVKSQTGTIRTYVLTFVKEKTDLITDETLQIAGLTIPGVYVPFESAVANYNISVDYSSDVIDIYTSLKNPESSSSVSIKKKGDKDYSLVSSKGINLDVGENFIEIRVVNSSGHKAYYLLTVIRKEYGLDVSKDTSLKDLKVLGYDIDFNPKNKEYTVRIKTEKSLVITAVPTSNRAEVFIRGNEELTGFSTVRVKVVAENGEYETYSIDIKKDAFNKTIEIGALIIGCVLILGSSYVIIKKKKTKKRNDYYRE